MDTSSLLGLLGERAPQNICSHTRRPRWLALPDTGPPRARMSAPALQLPIPTSAVTSRAPGRLLQLKLSPIAEHEHEPSQARHHAASAATAAATTSTRQPTDSSYSLCSVDKYNSSSRLSSTADEREDDCAGVVLACLFCRFYDLCLMLPGSCARAAQRLCPSYQHFAKTHEGGGSGSNGDCTCKCDFDCGLFDACHESGECLELAMEISEVCYH
ncbi:myoD family inhibitor domain-containing protein 2 [Sardina pilchardus]|uniref:myoD family inhibitor domain-containing protein 2 n=1 Tax=Sardina pilchardus TaxID=27697 RepID=UPI002E0DEC5A